MSNPIHMSRQNLATMMLLFLAQIPEDSDDYMRYNDIQLTLMGVLDERGNLTEDYAGSDMWKLEDDGELKPSSKAEIKSLIDPKLWGTLEG